MGAGGRGEEGDMQINIQLRFGCFWPISSFVQLVQACPSIMRGQCSILREVLRKENNILHVIIGLFRSILLCGRERNFFSESTERRTLRFF